MRRPVAILVSAAALSLSVAACGGHDEQDAAGGGIPTITKGPGGTGTASAPDGTAANHWCTLLKNGEGTTPDGKGRLPTGVTQVTFRLKDSGADIVCDVS